MKHSIFLILALFATGVKAEVTIPNTFYSGSAAVADEVNTNFTAVANGVNANETNNNNNSIAIGVVQSGVNANTDSVTSLSGEIATNTLAIAGKADAASVQANTNAIANKADAALGTVVTANSVDILDLQNAPIPVAAKSFRVSARDVNLTSRDIGTFVGYVGDKFLTYMSDKGFHHKIYSGFGSSAFNLIVDNEVASLYFPLLDCNPSGTLWAVVNTKQVFSSNNTLYYSMYAQNNTAYPGSVLINGTCFNNPGFPNGVLRVVVINDTTITGINEDLFSTAIVEYK